VMSILAPNSRVDRSHIHKIPRHSRESDLCIPSPKLSVDYGQDASGIDDCELI
jgi:hypothetical protein